MNTEAPTDGDEMSTAEMIESNPVLEEPEDDSSLPQSDIDKMTLEILLNRSTYKRYLAKQNPEMLNTYQTKQRQQTKYNTETRALVGELLEYVLSPDDSKVYPKHATTVMVDIMETLVDKCVAHLKTRDELQLDNQYAPAYDDAADYADDTMFGNVETTSRPEMSSFWGPKINRESRQPTKSTSYPAYTMDMYMSKPASKRSGREN